LLNWIEHVIFALKKNRAYYAQKVRFRQVFKVRPRVKLLIAMLHHPDFNPHLDIFNTLY